MKFIGNLVRFALLVFLAAGGVLGFCWLISGVVRWMWGLDTFQSAFLAFAVLGILVVFAIAAALKRIAENSDRIDETVGTEEPDEDEKEKGADEEDWFASCPCGRGRPFAQCCGKRAFRNRHSGPSPRRGFLARMLRPAEKDERTY